MLFCASSFFLAVAGGGGEVETASANAAQTTTLTAIHDTQHPPRPPRRSGALVLDQGELRWPAPPPKSLANAAAAAAPASDKKKDAKDAKAAGPKDLYPQTLSNALTTTGAAAATLAIGAVSPGSAFSSMLTKFGLASICGYQV